MTAVRTSQQLQRDIMHALIHGGLDQYQIAADVADAPFRVRAELRHLKRDRLVRDKAGARAITWELTDRGYTTALGADQLELR